MRLKIYRASVLSFCLVITALLFYHNYTDRPLNGGEAPEIQMRTNAPEYEVKTTDGVYENEAQDTVNAFQDHNRLK